MADIRLLLNDKAIARLRGPEAGWYLARDTELKGFFVVIGKRKKTFTVQGDLRCAAKRTSTIRVAIGDAHEMSTRTARAAAKDFLAQISRGQHPKAAERTENASEGTAALAPPPGVTLRDAWERYRDAHMVRKGRSDSTIKSYTDHVERIFVEWLDKPLRDLAEEPAQVAKKT